jgi:glycosyltransferase involved in cell wall biosynthesis
MRIGVDVRYLSHGLMGGVHTYVKYMVPAVIEAATDHRIYLYADTKRPFELEALPSHVTARYLPWRGFASSIYHDFSIWRVMAADQLDVVHFPANYGFGPPGARTVITLHDAINILPLREILRGHPKNARTMAMMTYLHFMTRAALRRADLIMTVSAHAAREIARYSKFDLSRIVSLPHAPTPDLRRIQDPTILEDVRKRHSLVRPFVLADALKNPTTLVRAWQQLPRELRQSRHIVFFSRRPDPLPVVHEAVAAGDACLLVRPSRADMIALYNMAEVFVFPSWIEGFGIPLLEAMTCGAPVIASDRGAIPEVVADAAILIDAEDDQELADHLRRLFEHPGEREHWRKLGFARAAQFSWPDIAQRLLGSYEQAMILKPTSRPSPVTLSSRG